MKYLCIVLFLKGLNSIPEKEAFTYSLLLIIKESLRLLFYHWSFKPILLLLYHLNKSKGYTMELDIIPEIEPHKKNLIFYEIIDVFSDY